MAIYYASAGQPYLNCRTTARGDGNICIVVVVNGEVGEDQSVGRYTADYRILSASSPTSPKVEQHGKVQRSRHNETSQK